MDDELDLTDESGGNQSESSVYLLLIPEELVASRTPLRSPVVGFRNRTSDPEDPDYPAPISSTVTMADIRRELKWPI